MFALAKASPHVVLFQRPSNYEWISVTARDFADDVVETAKGLISLGVEPGDRVVLLSGTRYEWNLLAFAIWSVGAVLVPVYPSSSHSQVQWVVEDSGAVLALTETREHTETLEHLVLQEDGTPALASSPSQLRRVLEINSSAVQTLKFEGRQIEAEDVYERIERITHDSLASINYTSGTTGNPKGCMLTHRNWIFEVRALLADGMGHLGHPGTRVVTYLPLAHVLAHAVSLTLIVSGVTQSHWGDTKTLTTALERFRPHLVLGVPRVFEKVRNAAYNKAADDSKVKGALFRQAEATAIEYSKALDTEEGPSRALKLRRQLFDKLVYSKLRAALGGQVEQAITGGSAMSADLAHFFRGLGVPVYEGYGLTETTAACAVGFEDQRIGSVGQPLNGYGARINEDGEICIRGGGLFTGYWNNEEATKQELVDGWFTTGDLGEISESGHITITGRSKDLIVTAGGKNISPGPMENILREHPLISQALVVGDGKPFPAALIALDDDELTRYKLDRNIPASRSVADMATDSALRGEIQDAINMANSTVSKAESIKKFWILDRDLSEEDNELTPTMKVKRNVVFNRFADEIAKIYER
ncbi:AMP-dependent synthetase/ligase [Corynebacterium tapiri]|uniref:Acyl-CoA synthetase n=1 Tax=Corynebacterium tapiri TaxID=1448266 RepID=A0A5C4U3T8_9CORY|nr:long-chain fatty acid--CoA ligase [Corynebacterium tapiri]TNL96682.1 long-chain fatty acid--CoA ligase [Corynebacterium tapiri]